jgi:2-oxoglutarate ferredoxin oxidoreductase subunit delta
LSKAVINPTFCKGCGICIDVCPKGLIQIGDRVNAKGHFYAVQENEEACTACKLCAIMCPDAAIEVFKF